MTGIQVKFLASNNWKPASLSIHFDSLKIYLELPQQMCMSIFNT